MFIISIAGLKGGSAKTTTGINLAAALQAQGKKILLIDADPQCNLTQSLGILEEPEKNLFTELQKEMEGSSGNLEDALLETSGGGRLIAASIELATAELELVSVYGREQLLTWLLKPLENKYDFIFIDCPPSIGMLTVNALMASHFVLMPLQAEYLPLKGALSFIKYLEHIEKLKKRMDQSIELLGLILNRYDERKNMNREVAKQLKDVFGTKLFDTHIRTNIQLAKAQEAGVDIFCYDKNSNGAADYMSLSNEFLKRVKPVDLGKKKSTEKISL
jgi:chromosome partitioning protein